MALILCPECASQVSSLAKACPKCGHPIGGDVAPASEPAGAAQPTPEAGAITQSGYGPPPTPNQHGPAQPAAEALAAGPVGPAGHPFAGVALVLGALALCSTVITGVQSALDRWLLGPSGWARITALASAGLVLLALDVHAYGPDEAEKLPPHRDDHFLVRHPPLVQSPIAAMEPVLSLPGDRLHRLLDIFLASSQRSVDSWTVPVGPGRVDENSANVAIARLRDPSPSRSPSYARVSVVAARVDCTLGDAEETSTTDLYDAYEEGAGSNEATRLRGPKNGVHLTV